MIIVFKYFYYFIGKKGNLKKKSFIIIDSIFEIKKKKLDFKFYRIFSLVNFFHTVF